MQYNEYESIAKMYSIEGEELKEIKISGTIWL